MSGRALRYAVGTAAAVLALPAPSHAHLVNTGLGPLYDGISHVLLTPEDLLPALAVALLAGQSGVRAGRLALFMLPAAWLVGGLVGLAAPTRPLAPAITTTAFVVLGGLIAAEVRPRSSGVAALAGIVGLLQGYLNGGAMVQARLGALWLAGVLAVLFVVVALATARVASLRAEWARIAVRVIGSWIAAIGLLLMGWGLQGA